MSYIHRALEKTIQETLSRGKSILLLGARQTGKTTLLNSFQTDLSVSFIQPAVRQKYERNPSRLGAEIEAWCETHAKCPLVLLDEVQKIPDMLDVAQDLIDRKKAQFILTGSSARKLRSGSHVNFLPGRVVSLRLDPLTFSESAELNPSLTDLLLYGALPGIVTVPDLAHRELDLASYVTTYLEEEIRSEALVRNVGRFSKFLALAASEAGQIMNFRKLSQDIGVAHTTIADYYQILEDCLILERIEPFTESSTRRRLNKSPRYLFFDMGVRRLCAEEGSQLPLEYWGRLFEQWVGLELIRMIRLSPHRAQLYFWRDANGPEVDWILKIDDELIPIEVKWTAEPNRNHVKHLELFKSEHPAVKKAFLICQVDHRMQISPDIQALPALEISSLLA